jgi:cytochrome c553
MMSFRTVAAICMSIALGHTAEGFAQGGTRQSDIETLTARCAFCHGPTGVSKNPIWPSLAGLDEAYLLKRMEHFRAGGDKHPSALQMRFVLSGNSANELRKLAKHYASQKPPARMRLPTVSDRQGQAIYRSEEGLGCTSCHGLNGEGNRELASPRIAGQSRQYTLNQLNAFASGQRSDNDSGMGALAQELTAEQRVAVAKYIETLGPR